MRKLVRLKEIVFFAIVIFSVLGCDKRCKKNTAVPVKPNQITDITISKTQNDLLDISFNIASSIPVYPHIKDRSRSQQEVVETCLTLGQFNKALEFTWGIENWCKGVCYAKLALYCAKNGYKKQMYNLLKLAYGETDKNIEDWRKSQIKIEIAKVCYWADQYDEVASIEDRLEDSEKGIIDFAKVQKNSMSFEEQVNNLDRYIATGNFDAIKNSLNTYVELYNEFYPEIDKRNVVEDKIKSSWKPMPIFIRIETLTNLASYSLEHKDVTKTIELIKEAEVLIESYDWPLRHRIPMVSKLLTLRFESGDKNTALGMADSLLMLYQNESNKIVNIYKAETLIPLAESYQAMGNVEKAAKVYGMAIEGAIENPNSRPRAIDLSAVCNSMALNNFKYDKQAINTILNLSLSLSEPW